jgi:hypothetical protein
MNVRALPTWRKPVGDGAKRTLSLDLGDVEGWLSGISGKVRWYGSEKSIVKRAKYAISDSSD